MTSGLTSGGGVTQVDSVTWNNDISVTHSNKHIRISVCTQYFTTDGDKLQTPKT